MRSISASSSADGIHSAGGRIGLNLLGRHRSRDHRRTTGLRGECTDGHVQDRDAVRLRPGNERLDGCQLLRRHIALAPGQPAACRYRLALPDLASQQAVGERKVRQHADAEVPGRGDDIRLGRTLEQRPVILGGDERGVAVPRRQVRRVGQPPAGEVRVAHVPDLALGHQFVQRCDRFLDRGHRVRGVQLVQVDVVGTQPAQRLGHRAPDVGASALRADGRPVPHVGVLVAELGGQHDLVAARAEDLAERPLRTSAAAISVRGVEQRDAGIDGRVHHLARPVHVEPAAEVVAAQPDHRHQQPGCSE